MRASVIAAALVAACIPTLLGGCNAPSSPTSPTPPATDPPPADAKPATVPDAGRVVVAPPPGTRTSHTATRIAELMILEGELRLKLNACADDAERDKLTRQIEDTERARIELYHTLTETK